MKPPERAPSREREREAKALMENSVRAEAEADPLLSRSSAPGINSATLWALQLRRAGGQKGGFWRVFRGVLGGFGEGLEGILGGF